MPITTFYQVCLDSFVRVVTGLASANPVYPDERSIMSRLISALLAVGLLAACGQPGSASLPTATAPAPTQLIETVPAPTQPVATTTPIRVDLTPAQRAAVQALATAIKVPVDQIKLNSTEAIQWPDGCLGIVRMGVMCLRGPIDGFRIILEENGQQYEYHTNQDGTSVARLNKAPFVSLAVRGPDHAIHIINTQIPTDPRPVQITTGLLSQAGVVSGTVYALDFTNQPRAVAMDASGTRPLDFIHNPNYGLAVISGDQPRLSWATTPSPDGAPSQLFVSATDGSQLTSVLTSTMPITAMQQWVTERWARDGQSLYFSAEPYGIGGYILFSGASSLYRVNLNDRSVQAVIPFKADGGKLICIDELSTDERLIADHCAKTTITIQDLGNGQTTTIQPPANVKDYGLVGSARFSPDLTRVAFALAKGNPDAEQGWVAVSDGLSGPSKLVATSQPGEYFTVAGWLNADTLLLQSNQVLCNPACTNSLWSVKIDGSGLTHIADGTFLTLME